MEVFRTWYDEEDCQPQIVHEAFEAAKKHFENSSSLSDEEKQVVTTATRLEDVHKTVSDLLVKYKCKAETSKTRKWLQRASETICHYGPVLDVFVQHHPEYVSLSTVNHAETLQLLSKSISQVAGRLPRITILSILYPTGQIRSTVENLYSSILSFLVMVHSWCNEPHALRYGEILGRIADYSNNIIESASVGSQAEIRVMHESHTSKLDSIISTLEVADKERKDQLDCLTHVVSRLEGSHRGQEKKAASLTTHDLMVKLETFHSIQASAQLNTNQQLTDLQRSQVLATFSLTFEDPDACYKQHLFFRRRRATGMGAITSTNKFWLSPKLGRLSSSHDSSLVVVKGAFMSRLAMQDFGTDVIEALAASAVPTVWALSSLEKSRSTSILTAMDLMKYLAYQALRLRGVAETEKQMAVQQIYIVVDLAIVRASLEGIDGTNFIKELNQMLDEITRGNRAARVKVILLMYEADWFRLLPEDVSSFVIAVKAARSTRSQTREMRHAVNTRVLRNFRNGHGGGQEKRLGRSL
ncbi:hypothetical protein GGR52DRAFT_582020 [Hypoxylon sp. FL1284]|nr:hypothetical protein GGR52DRAFT_582020 [Hypoxylon sp. FL1284]